MIPISTRTLRRNALRTALALSGALNELHSQDRPAGASARDTTLVFVSAGEDGTLEPIVCLVSGADRVDLERLAAVVGRRDVRRATAREADELTGYTIGGIPPFGHPNRTRVIMDPDLGRYETVWAAAGLPTAVFPVAPSVLRMLADAHVAPIAEEPPVEPSA